MVTCRLGKPHPEQGQIGPAPWSPLLERRPGREGPLSCPERQAGRVGRWSPSATAGLEEWSSGRAARPGRTESGLQTDFGLSLGHGQFASGQEMTKASDAEYAEVCLTIRHYSALRFAMRTLLLVIFVGLAVIAFGIIPQPSFLAKTVAKASGIVMTWYFWVSEKSAARYMSHLRERAAELEEALGYRVWSGMPKSPYFLFIGGFVAPLVYGCLALFWIYALVFVR